MRLTNPGAQIYVPDGIDVDRAVARTTHLAVGAHPDDIPIMAFDGVVRCLDRADQWFLGITVTNGAGSPRAGAYGEHNDDEIRDLRIEEERKAAAAGQYGGAVLLDYASAAVRGTSNTEVIADLTTLLDKARPRVVYTHNLADKHDTHVAVALRTLAALRSLPAEARPAAVYGCEVWRDLDWMVDSEKVTFDVSGHEELAATLMGTYDSQVGGGKRYDRAVPGRRHAHATFSEPHVVDASSALMYAMDLTPLMADDSVPVATYVADHVKRLEGDVADRVQRLR